MKVFINPNGSGVTAGGSLLVRRAVQELPRVLSCAAQLDAAGNLRDSVDEREQAEQQREGVRADAGAGEQHDAEGDGHQAAEQEQGAGASGLPGGEREGELGDAPDDRPDSDDNHQHQRGGPGPDDRDHAGRYVDQAEQQVTDNRSRAIAAEGSRALQDGVAERVDREQDDQREDRHPRPGQRDDPSDDRRDADPDH
jgi:hypothetical protein